MQSLIISLNILTVDFEEKYFVWRHGVNVQAALALYLCQSCSDKL
jgi:hypothetical protein